jgi:ribonucleotide monophosphatase NagD (HAD superfamily)
MVRHLVGGLDPAQILVVGDRLYTDMSFARELGAQSALVLSGETSRDDIEDVAEYPSVVARSVADFL